MGHEVTSSGEAEQPEQAEVVLVVEDDPEVRQLLVSELEDLPSTLNIESFSDGNHALERIRAEGAKPVALVLSDIRLPGLDGVELTRELKRLDRRIEVILVTGFGTVETATEALRLGAFDYLTKPFDDLTLVGQRVQAALDKRRRRRRAAERQRQLEADEGSLTLLLDALPMAVLLLDSEGRAHKTNASARRLMSERDALRLDAQGRPEALHRETARSLAKLLQEATAVAGRRHGGTLTIPRVPTGAPLSALISPLEVDPPASPFESSDSLSPPSRLVVALLIADPTENHESAEEVIAGLYGLTPAEARLAKELMQGKNLEVAAHTLGITSHTARTHLKRVFAKTRTTRQGELISLLLSGPALLSAL